MASATATARAEPARAAEGERPRRPRRFGGSRLGGLILALNLVSLLILFVGALLLNEWTRGLIEARQETLKAQGEILAQVLSERGVTQGEPQPSFDEIAASRLFVDVIIPEGQRARLFGIDGTLVADSYRVTEAIPGQPLPAALPAGSPAPETDEEADRAALRQAEAALSEEIRAALDGEPQATVRNSESGDRVVSVSIPVRHVRQVLGVLTLEAGDVDETLAAQRRALMPFALVALGVNLLGSLLMHLFVARPVMRLSAAADEVRLQRSRAISLPDLERRKDEIGDLARSLETMTAALSDRMDAIEAFAADVAHEIKNPLTSIRSALETLPLVRTDSQREKLTALLQQDVRRLDRLITDISNASRLDAELNRDRPRTVDLTVLLGEIVGVYEAGRKPGEAAVAFEPFAGGHAMVVGRDGPLGQVFRNLIDNARSFSPPDGTVRVSLARDDLDGARPVRVRVDDDGPGVPPENLETIFERFYTSRPRGTAFGTNSGLGLSIVRQIVEAHGGRVWAINRTRPDGGVAGARLEVALPAAPAGRRP